MVKVTVVEFDMGRCKLIELDHPDSFGSNGDCLEVIGKNLVGILDSCLCHISNDGGCEWCNSLRARIISRVGHVHI